VAPSMGVNLMALLYLDVDALGVIKAITLLDITLQNVLGGVRGANNAINGFTGASGKRAHLTDDVGLVSKM